MSEEVNSSQFPGIHLDRGLTFNVHIDSVCTELAFGVFIFRALAKYCPFQVLMTADYGLIYPHLTNGVVLLSACANYQFLRALNRSCFRSKHCNDQENNIVSEILADRYLRSCNMQLLSLPSLCVGDMDKGRSVV